MTVSNLETNLEATQLQIAMMEMMMMMMTMMTMTTPTYIFWDKTWRPVSTFQRLPLQAFTTRSCSSLHFTVYKVLLKHSLAGCPQLHCAPADILFRDEEPGRSVTNPSGHHGLRVWSPYRPACLNTWSPAGDAVLESYRALLAVVS